MTMSEKKNQKCMLKSQSLTDTKKADIIYLNNDTCERNEQPQLRRKSLFSIPKFSPFRRRALVTSPKKGLSLDRYTGPPSPLARSDHPILLPGSPCRLTKEYEFHRQTSMFDGEVISSPKDIYDSPKHAPYQNHAQLNFINNSNNHDEELMVCADAFVTKSGVSTSTPTPSRKNSKASPLSHGDLMGHIKDSFQYDEESIEMTLNTVVGTPPLERTWVYMGDQEVDVSSAPPSIDTNTFNRDHLQLMLPKLDNSLPLMRKSDSCLSSPEEKEYGECRLSRNLTLPIKAIHLLSSPINRRSCISLGNTPEKVLYRSFSEIQSKQTPKKQKISSLPSYYQNKMANNNSNDYVQQLYGDLADENNNPDYKSEPSSSDSGASAHSSYSSPSKSCGETPSPSPFESPRTASRRSKIFGAFSKKSPAGSPKKSPKEVLSPKKSNFSPSKSRYTYNPDKESLTGYLFVNVNQGKGFTKNSDTYVILEIDSYGHFFKKAKTKPSRGSDPQWDEAFEFEIEACNWLRLSCYNKLRLMGDDISGKVSINLSRENLIPGKNRSISVVLDRGQSIMNISLCFSTSIDGIKKSPSFTSSAVFGVPISVVSKRERSVIPVAVISCIKEIEKRGMDEIGIYRLSGIASEIQNLKKLFNEQTQSAVLALSETDIHAVAGLLKLYFRELPQSLFTSKLYHKFVEGLSITDAEEKELYMCDILQQLPRANKMTALYLFEHLRRVSLLEQENKMGVNNLATVFGPTVLRPPSSTGDKENERSMCNIGTFDIGALDVMSQVGIFRYFLGLKNNERTKLPQDDLELWRRLDYDKASKLEEKLMETAEEFLI